MLKGFRDFILKGNVVDLAVAVVVGGAFGAIVTALVKDLITPLIAAIGGNPDFSGIYFTLNNSKFMIGDFLNSLVSFLLIAAAIYFLVVVPMQKIAERRKPAEVIEPTEIACPECLSMIPKEAKRCKFCTAVVKQ